MISPKEKDKLHIFALKCIGLRNALALGTHSLTPINYDEERTKFFQSKTYNPIFSYDKKSTRHLIRHIDSLFFELENIKIPNELQMYLFYFS